MWSLVFLYDETNIHVLRNVVAREDTERFFIFLHENVPFSFCDPRGSNREIISVYLATLREHFYAWVTLVILVIL